MKRFMKASIVLMLIVSLCLGNFAGIWAWAAETTENGNIWFGDEVAVDVTAGTDGYNYMALFRKPVHGYEFSGHFMGEGEGPQTFVLLDTVAHNGTTWTPSGIYEHGNSNYEVVYCCDVETMIVDATYYKRVNLEDSGYYNDEQAAKIRAILTSAYPYVSLETMKTALAEAGFEYAEELTRNEIIAAVQTAIWACANTNGEPMRYAKSYNVSDNLQWGYPMHDTSSESGLDVSGTRVFKTYEEVGERIDGLVDYLLALEPVKANANQMVITKLDVVKSQINDTEGAYDVALNVELNHSADADDEVVLKAYVNGEMAAEVQVTGEKNYTVNMKAAEGDQIKVVVSGTQNLERGVYFYAPKPEDVNGDGIATSREVSQNTVGVSMGATPVHAEANVTIENGALTADKTANKIDNQKYDISIEVPGGDAEVKHDEIILMVDGSYSMDNEWPAMKNAITEIGKTVLDGSGHTVLTLMAFGMGDNEVLVHVKTVDELVSALGELPGNLLYGRSSTNCEAGFTGVAEYIENHNQTLGEVKVIFISDGNVNTDETPRAFDANWQTWTKFGSVFVAQAAFEETLLYGENLPAAFATVFGDRFDGATTEEILDRAFGGEVTDEEFITFAEQLWTDVYAYSGLTRGVEYPVSDAERAFVKYDKENGTYIQDLFYYTTYQSKFVTYGDRWTRTPAAAIELANMEQVKHLYIVDYDGKSAWMDLGHEKSTFILSSGIAGLLTALESTLEELSKTPYNDVVVTDYMSKWVLLDPTTIHVVDGNGNVIAVFDAENSPKDADGNYTAYLYKWVGEALCAEKAPIVLELVPESEYEAGGADVIGNADGPIYRITWNLKDGPLMRNEAFKLQYEVTMNTEEPGFEYNKDYPANGNTYSEYIDDNGEKNKVDIKVPNIVTEQVLTQVTVNKTWDDNNDQDGIRPESITIRLLANGVEVDSMVVTEEMGWSYTFENLNKYANGEQIVYTITEDQVEGYTTVIDGFNVTNIHAAEQTQVSVQKVWDDDDDFEGKRPESITIRLFANNVEMEAVTVTEEMGWSYTFENLPLNVNGEKIVYTVAEDTVENYEMIELSGDAENGFRIVNQYQIVVEDPEPPRTGDPIALVMAMAAISMMGLAVIVLQRKKFN